MEVLRPDVEPILPATLAEAEVIEARNRAYLGYWYRVKVSFSDDQVFCRGSIVFAQDYSYNRGGLIDGRLLGNWAYSAWFKPEWLELIG